MERVRAFVELYGMDAGESGTRSLSTAPPARGRCVGPRNPFVSFAKEDIEQSIARRFEQLVTRYPDRSAVVTGSRSWTYKELNQAANRVAHAIVQLRGTANEPIALRLEHGADLIVGILGVLKAGKIYVYLDPSFPETRIGEILEDSEPALVVTNDRSLYRSSESGGTSVHQMNIDDLDPSLSSENLGTLISPDAPAWILYTSGSTGRPKGVVHNQRNLLHNVMTYTNGMHICADDRLTLLHSCNVITSAKNLFGALLNGATLYPFNVREESIRRLGAWLMQEEITVYHSVPSLFRRLVEALQREDSFPKLRLIALGSEPVTKRDVEAYKTHFAAGCVLVNLLGSTELATYRQYFVDRSSAVPTSILPAGYAVEDKEVRLLDDSGNEVGPDCTGEIAVKSRYLAIGYWRDPAGAKSAFAATSAGQNERVHLTGDLGRMLPDGCLLYLGRKDFQVKIRGHRVDLAEVEMVLLDHAAIKDAIVVAHDDDRRGKFLTAYIVADEKEAVTIGALRSFLAAKLPGHMVPSFFVLLDALPVTQDGKVDRQKLPLPNRARLGPEVSFVAPRTPVERQLAELWCDVLALEQIGIHDNFFDVGGHSLAATQLISRVHDIFKVDLAVSSLLARPTVANMAAVVLQHQSEMIGPNEVAEDLAELDKLSEEEAQRLVGQLSDKGRV
jgi:amino acid adenylation domain-containing protein